MVLGSNTNNFKAASRIYRYWQMFTAASVSPCAKAKMFACVANHIFYAMRLESTCDLFTLTATRFGQKQVTSKCKRNDVLIVQLGRTTRFAIM